MKTLSLIFCLAAFSATAAESKTAYNVVRPGMVRISYGENVGTNEDREIGSYRWSVKIPFHMDQTEITLKQWRDVKKWATERTDIKDATVRGFFRYEFDNRESGKGDDHPVVGVSWFDCVKWCNARSEMEGLTPCYTIGGAVLRGKCDGSPDCNMNASGYRLPSVQERSYAARGGLVGKRYPWGDIITHENANYFSAENIKNEAGTVYDNSKTRGCHPAYAKSNFPYTNPVKAFAPNAFGLYGMAGNVSEWLWAPKGASRTTAGGSWDTDASGLRNDLVFTHDSPGERTDTIGFRTVRIAGQ